MGTATLDFPTRKQLHDSSNVNFKLIVPSTRAFSKKIHHAAFKKRIATTLNDLTRVFEGASVDMQYGTYLFKGKVIREDVAIISIFTTQEAYNKYDEWLKRYVKTKRESWEQDSIGFEYEGKFVMVR